MRNPFTRFNVWFDSLKEPRRFIIFLFMVLGWWLPLTLALYVPDPFQIALRIIGGTWSVIMLLIAISRI